MLGCVDKVFDDKRLAVVMLFVWMFIVMLGFDEVGLLDTKFMSFGPSDHLTFMGAHLDTWYKWNLVATYTFVNTCLGDFLSDSITPFLINTVADHKAKYIPYPKWVCLGISQCWSIYCNIMSVFGLFLAMTQMDFVLIRLVADICVSSYTNMKYMRHKIYCKRRYEQAFSSEAEPDAHSGSSYSIEEDSDPMSEGMSVPLRNVPASDEEVLKGGK